MRQHGQQNLLTHVIGSTAAILSLYTLFINRTDFIIAAASVYFLLACYTDCRYHKIPNAFNASLAIAGLAFNTYVAGMAGLFYGLSGMFLGIALLFLPFLAGGFGAGDVKALGALGALIGPYDLLHVFAYMALFGGVLALLYNLCSSSFWQRFHYGWISARASFLSRDTDHKQPARKGPAKSLVRFPYATAIAFGYFCFIYRGGII